jgi:hypothetical protein
MTLELLSSQLDDMLEMIERLHQRLTALENPNVPLYYAFKGEVHEVGGKNE